jgi:hypothetical protein
MLPVIDVYGLKMLKNNYHYKLSFPVDFIPTYLEGDTFRNVYPVELINQELVDWLNKLNIFVIMAEQYMLDPNGKKSSYEIHRDGQPDVHPDFIKMNYVFCDTPHVMNWYKLHPGKELKNAGIPGGFPFLVCDEGDCDLVHSAEVGQPSLVNVMELHDVSTVLSKRYCFAFVLGNIETKQPINWNEAEELFKEYIIE